MEDKELLEAIGQMIAPFPVRIHSSETLNSRQMSAMVRSLGIALSLFSIFHIYAGVKPILFANPV